MNCKNPLSLLAISAAASPMLVLLLTATKAEAIEAIKITMSDSSDSIAAQSSCDAPTHSNRQSSGFSHRDRSILIASAGIAGDDFDPGFSEAESDAAVTLFGCDCPACLRSLKQLQRQSLTSKISGSSSQGHCWTALQKRTSPQVVKEVLKTLESQKTN
jgi:hypothetical protein